MSIRDLVHRRFVVLLVLWTLIIHLVFVCQRLMIAIPQGGMMSDEYGYLFKLHSYFIVYLPPEYPISTHGINYWGVAWKSIVSIPASVLYAMRIGLVLDWLFTRFGISKHEIQ